MNNEVRKRLGWVKLYESVGNAGIVCLRCGITRPTLRKWVKRFKESGIDGLSELRRRPHKIHHRIAKEDEHRIRELKTNRNLGYHSMVDLPIQRSRLTKPTITMAILL